MGARIPWEGRLVGGLGKCRRPAGKPGGARSQRSRMQSASRRAALCLPSVVCDL